MLSPVWRRTIDAARAGLAVGGLLIEFAAAANSGLLIRVSLGAYLVYSLLMLFRGARSRDGASRVRLAVDMGFFLVCASMRSDQAIWLCGFAYIYLLVTAVLLYRWPWAFAAGAAPAALIYLVRPEDAARLVPVFLAAAVPAIVFAIYLQGLSGSLDLALREAGKPRAGTEAVLERERERIAADFHDGPQQGLVTLQMRLDVLRKLMERDPAAAAEELSRLRDLAREQVAEVRAFVRSLRPPDLEEAALPDAVAQVVAGFEKASGITAKLICESAATLDSGLAREVVQIVREALHNVQKHSGASHAEVRLKRLSGHLELSVADNGSGFDFAGTLTLDELELLGKGPASIRRRVRGLGGDLTLESRPGNGTALTVRVPV